MLIRFTSSANGEVSIDDRFFHIFRDTARTRLRRACLKGAKVSDEAIEILTGHALTDLDISDCPSLTPRCLTLLNRRLPLQRLAIGNSHQILDDFFSSRSGHSTSVHGTAGQFFVAFFVDEISFGRDHKSCRLGVVDIDVRPTFKETLRWVNFCSFGATVLGVGTLFTNIILLWTRNSEKNRTTPTPKKNQKTPKKD